MKHLIYLILAVGVLTACNNTSSTESSTSNNDSIADTTETKTETFQSADLTMQDLIGQVKSMSNTTYTCDAKGNIIKDSEMGDTEVTMCFDFDENGLMTRGFAYSEDDKGMTLKRNSKGQIESASSYIAELNFTRTDKFTYNEDGRLATHETKGFEGQEKRTYKYTNGILTTAKAIEAGEGELFDIELTYKIKEIDDHGNWTKRFFTCLIKIGPDDGSGIVESSETQYGLEERKIEYYK